MLKPQLRNQQNNHNQKIREEGNNNEHQKPWLGDQEGCHNQKEQKIKWQQWVKNHD
jgi:hypothetical protein